MSKAMTENSKTLITGVVGLLVGAIVTYFALEKLTEKVVEASIKLGEINFQTTDMKNRLVSLENEFGRITNSLPRLENRAKQIGSNLDLLEATNEVELGNKIKAIENISEESKNLIGLSSRLNNLQQEIDNLKSTSVIKDEKWLLLQDPEMFTVQIATSRERHYISELSVELAPPAPLAIFSFVTSQSEIPVWGLLSGLYGTRAEAIAAVDGMDNDVKQFGVWIRPVGDIQASIK